MIHAALAAVLALASAAVPVQDRAPEPEPPPSQSQSIEDEVVGNIVGQSLGAGTVADLALPANFLERVADRIIRDSYAQRYRVIVRDPNEPAETAGEALANREAASGEPPSNREPTSSEPLANGAPASGEPLANGAPGPNEPAAKGTATSTREALESNPAGRSVDARAPAETAPAVQERRALPAWAFALAGGAVVLVLLLAARGARTQA